MIHGQIHSAGMWLEFEPCRQPGMSSSPSPVLWFRFWAGCELRALQSYHRNYLVRAAASCSDRPRLMLAQQQG